MDGNAQGSPRQVALIAVLFALSATGSVVIVSVAAVTALDLTGSYTLATLPVALSLLGGMLATVPAAHLMQRQGRRTGFQAAALLALVGSGLAVVAILQRSFVLFCAGSFLIGVLGGVGQQYRFAAVEVAAPGKGPAAIGRVLVGGVVAGVLGPIIAFQARDLLPYRYAGSYAAMATLVAVLILLLVALRVPTPAPVRKGEGRTLAQLARDPRYVAAVLAGAAAFGAMVLTMVAAPLSLAAQGAEDSVAWVIQAHVVAMYLPSFFTGPLVGRIGVARGMALGIALLAACGVVNLMGHSVPHHYVALVLLGVGWNLLFVAGTALLTTTHTPAEKATAQGSNDFVGSAIGAAAALGAGTVHAAHGWAGLNLDVLLGLALAGLGLIVLLRARPRTGQGFGPGGAAVPVGPSTTQASAAVPPASRH